MNNPHRTSGKFGVARNDLKPNQFAWPREFGFGDYRPNAASPGFELLLETPSVTSGPGERYVNTSTWTTNPLRSHGGIGANVLLRWNLVPTDARAIDVVVHLHGFIRGSNDQMLRTVAGYSGLDLKGRARPTLGILPRGRLITPEEVRQNQARLDEVARKSGKKPQKARSDVQTFPGLLPDAGAGLEALINGALQWFTQQRGGGPPLTIARLILTAHSGGGGALNRLVASHARRTVCNPDEVHAFDALYSEAGGLKSWVTARLAVDRSRQSNQLDSLGGALRVFYRRNTGTQPWSERLGRSLPPASDPLSRFYRIDCSSLDHFQIPKQIGPPLLRNRTADVSSLGPCATGARSTPAKARAGTVSKQASTGSAPPGGPSGSPARAPLPTDVRAWIRSIDRSAIELVADEALRRRFLQEIDWSLEYFPGNLDAQNKRVPGRLAEELFNAMARVTPERRVPRGIRFHDVTRVVVSVPGQADKKLLPEARDAFVRMRDAAAADSVQLEIISAWRSVKRNEAARLRQTNPNAVAPGISPHNYGLAIDLNMRVTGLTLVNVSTRARDKMANMVRMYRSPNYKWLVINASRFGWFPYKREPWHWEYNPPGLKERFEASAGKGTASEFGAMPRAHSNAAQSYVGFELENPAAYYGERVLDFITKWGRNASPFKIANTYLKLNWQGIKYWRQISKAAASGRALLNRIDGLEKGARVLKKATVELENAERQLPSYPLQTDDKAGRVVVTATELDYVERYLNTASIIANDARDARTALDQAIAGWDAAIIQANKTKDFTRKAAWEAITYLDLRFSNEGGSFRAYLVQARDVAARVASWADLKYYHAAHILGKWTPAWYQAPTPG